LPEILGDGMRGWLIPPGDAGALAAALDEIARRPDVAAERGRAARAWYLEEASPPAIQARLHAVIDAVETPAAPLARTELV